MTQPQDVNERRQREKELAEQRQAERADAQAQAAGGGAEPSVAEKARQAGMSEERFKALAGRTSIDEWEQVDKAERGS